MKELVASLGLPIRDGFVVVDQQHTRIYIVSSLPQDMDAVQEAASRFVHQGEPDGLGMKSVAAVDRSGRVLDGILILAALWNHNNSSTPPQIVETSSS